jgi:alginate O-acetyltransferase complex protein AlgI
VQIYFDFSGYSDMALGLALMLGFRFPENFNAPYASRSLREFWRRWHMSLSAWLRDYVYIPLGGSRKGRARTALNLVITLFLAGIWHGAGWTFALWGLWHGLLLAAERLTGLAPKGAWGRVYTLSAVGLSWVLFRAADPGAALSFWRALAGLNGLGISDVFSLQVRGLSILALLCGLGVIAAEPRMLKAWRSPVALPGGGLASESLPPAGAQAATVALFALALTRLLAMGETPFLYERF